MNTYCITFTPNKSDFQTILIQAPSYTSAYMEFTITHPKNCEITDISEVQDS